MNPTEKPKIYLDTTVPNYLYANDSPARMTDTWQLWEMCIAGEFEIFVSDVFFEEFDRCYQPKLSWMYEQMGKIKYERLEESDEVRALAAKYIKNGVLTQRRLNDCLHIASAVVYGCHVILSWNFDDIVNDSTRNGVKIVNAISRYNEIWIVSPEQFLKGVSK